MSDRADQIQQILQELVNGILDLEGAAMVTTDGLTLASALPNGSDEDRVSAMAAAILSMGERTAAELKRGTLEQVIVKGNGGYVVLMQAGPESVLEAISGSAAKLGMVLLDMKRAAAELSRLV
ncbi:MAG TPA: roadblock/LC7 domain-containing protein [Kineosporiaceae bacterium]|jgi:predicted regulator of Ras-like GTPase activity (Roadblock/LC7/MglB family)|nr:roadblock/LC7 domain-containing protein [Kineosporiaceae bacterium]